MAEEKQPIDHSQGSSLQSTKRSLLALTGVRRSGKSSMTVQLALGRLEETFFFNFEDPIFFPGATQCCQLKRK